METARSQSHRLRFAEFTLDTQRRGLYRGEERVRLTAKPLEALIFLVENGGRTVGKQELLDAVWTNTFVTEDVLTHAVRDIRRALGDDKDNPRFVQTIPRQGYRFLCEVIAAVEPPAASQTRAEISAPPAAVETPGRAPRWLWVVAVAAILLFISIPFLKRLIWTNSQPGQPSPLPAKLTQITSGEFARGKPVFSPDGKLILYVSSDAATRGTGNLFIQQFLHSAVVGDPLRITNEMSPSGDLPVFTGDGQFVVCSVPRKDDREVRHHDLWIVPQFGGPPIRFLEDASGAGFSPDGLWVAYTRHLTSGDVLCVSLVGNREEHVEVCKEGYTPRWSPDGQWLAYTTSNPNAGEGSLWICRVAQAGDGQPMISDQKRITQDREQMYGLSWTADSRAIIFASKRTGSAQLYQVALADGSVKPLLTGVGEYAAPSASPDGSAVIFQHYRFTNDLLTATLGPSSEARPITYGEFHRWPRLSPSGEKLASVKQEIDESLHLTLTDLRTRTSSPLTDRPAGYPCWLDNEQVAFLSPAPSRDTEVLAVNIVSRQTRSLAQFSGEVVWLAVHPDGKRLAVVQKSADGVDGQERIVLRDLNNQTDTVIHQGSEYEYLRWLPGGSALSWSRPGVSRNAPHISGGIWMIELGQAEPRLVVKDGFCPVWSDDGATVYFSGKQGGFGLWRYDLRQANDSPVCRWENRGLSYDLAGQRLVFTQHKNDSQIYSLSLDQ